ncbi:TATA-box-binding protein [Tardisphaera miroshnichenkoae]
MKGELNVENVVASVSFGQPIDLYALANKNPYLRYEPARFPAIQLRFVNPRVTVLIFSSGKAVIVGARSEDDVKKSSRNLASFLKKNGIGLKREPKVAIKNIVTTFSIGERIDLERLGMALRGAVYEPEEFPGLIYRNYGVVFIMFSSGKVICTGSKNETQAVQAVKQVIKEIGGLLA